MVGEEDGGGGGGGWRPLCYRLLIPTLFVILSAHRRRVRGNLRSSVLRPQRPRPLHPPNVLDNVRSPLRPPLRFRRRVQPRRTPGRHVLLHAHPDDRGSGDKGGVLHAPGPLHPD